MDENIIKFIAAILQGQQNEVVQAAQQGDRSAMQAINIIQRALNNDPQAVQLINQIQQQLQVPASKNGSKLEYIRQLNGMCPEGTTARYFERGGKPCKVCEQNNPVQSMDAIEAFKCGGKKKKMADGGRTKVTLKSEKTSTNKYGDRVTTRRWSDGTTSKRYTPEEGETIYEGRNGLRDYAKQDSLYNVDWRLNYVPELFKLKKK